MYILQQPPRPQNTHEWVFSQYHGENDPIFKMVCPSNRYVIGLEVRADNSCPILVLVNGVAIACFIINRAGDVTVYPSLVLPTSILLRGGDVLEIRAPDNESLGYTYGYIQTQTVSQ